MLELLEMGHQVSLKGLGVWHVATSPSTIDTRARIVNPPTSIIVFEADQGQDDTLLVKFLAYRNDIPLGHAESHVRKFTESISSRLENDSLVHIESFGRLQKTNVGLIFVADPGVENMRYRSLEAVALPSLPDPPVQIEKVEVEAVAPLTVSDDELMAVLAASSVQEKSQETEPEEETPVVEEKRERQRRPLAIVLPLFLMVFASVVILAILQYNRSHEDPFATTIFNKTPKTTNPVIDSKLSPPAAAETTSTAELDSEEYQFDIYPSLEFNGLDSMLQLDLDIPIDEAEDEASIEPEAHAKEEQEKDKLEGQESAIAKESELTTANDLVKPSTAEADCYVVVGAFGVPSNVTRMIERLNAMGYPADTMPNRGLTQVGVPADCNGAEIQNILQVLQSEVEPQAWIYNK